MVIADHGQGLRQTASPSLHHLAHHGDGELLHLALLGDGELLLLVHLGAGGGMAKQALPAFFRFSSSFNSLMHSLNSIQLKPNAAPPQGLRFRVSRDDTEVNPIDYHYYHHKLGKLSKTAGLNMYEKSQEMEFSDLTYLLFSRIFLSGIGGYPPPPLNGKSSCPKTLSGRGGTPFLNGKIR